MAIHSNILAWRIPRTEEPCGLQSMESQRVRHNLATNFGRLVAYFHSTLLWFYSIRLIRLASEESMALHFLFVFSAVCLVREPHY